MAEDSRDVLLRIGFTEHPQAGAALQAMSRGAIEAQGAISKAIESTGSAAVNEASRIKTAIEEVHKQAGNNPFGNVIEQLAASQKQVASAITSVADIAATKISAIEEMATSLKSRINEKPAMIEIVARLNDESFDGASSRITEWAKQNSVALDVSLAPIAERLESIGGISVPVDLDLSKFQESVDGVSVSLSSIGESVDNAIKGLSTIQSVDVSIGMDTTASEEGLAKVQDAMSQLESQLAKPVFQAWAEASGASLQKVQADIAEVKSALSEPISLSAELSNGQLMASLREVQESIAQIETGKHIVDISVTANTSAVKEAIEGVSSRINPIQLSIDTESVLSQSASLMDELTASTSSRKLLLTAELGIDAIDEKIQSLSGSGIVISATLDSSGLDSQLAASMESMNGLRDVAVGLANVINEIGSREIQFTGNADQINSEIRSVTDSFKQLSELTQSDVLGRLGETVSEVVTSIKRHVNVLREQIGTPIDVPVTSSTDAALESLSVFERSLDRMRAQETTILLGVAVDGNSFSELDEKIKGISAPISMTVTPSMDIDSVTQKLEKMKDQIASIASDSAAAGLSGWADSSINSVDRLSDKLSEFSETMSRTVSINVSSDTSSIEQAMGSIHDSVRGFEPPIVKIRTDISSVDEAMQSVMNSLSGLSELGGVDSLSEWAATAKGQIDSIADQFSEIKGMFGQPLVVQLSSGGDTEQLASRIGDVQTAIERMASGTNSIDIGVNFDPEVLATIQTQIESGVYSFEVKADTSKAADSFSELWSSLNESSSSGLNIPVSITADQDQISRILNEIGENSASVAITADAANAREDIESIAKALNDFDARQVRAVVSLEMSGESVSEIREQLNEFSGTRNLSVAASVSESSIRESIAQIEDQIASMKASLSIGLTIDPESLSQIRDRISGIESVVQLSFQTDGIDRIAKTPMDIIVNAMINPESLDAVRESVGSLSSSIRFTADGAGVSESLTEIIAEARKTIGDGLNVPITASINQRTIDEAIGEMEGKSFSVNIESNTDDLLAEVKVIGEALESLSGSTTVSANVSVDEGSTLDKWADDSSSAIRRVEDQFSDTSDAMAGEPTVVDVAANVDQSSIDWASDKLKAWTDQIFNELADHSTIKVDLDDPFEGLDHFDWVTDEWSKAHDELIGTVSEFGGDVSNIMSGNWRDAIDEMNAKSKDIEPVVADVRVNTSSDPGTTQDVHERAVDTAIKAAEERAALVAEVEERQRRRAEEGQRSATEVMQSYQEAQTKLVMLGLKERADEIKKAAEASEPLPMPTMDAEGSKTKEMLDAEIAVWESHSEIMEITLSEIQKHIDTLGKSQSDDPSIRLEVDTSEVAEATEQVIRFISEYEGQQEMLAKEADARSKKEAEAIKRVTAERERAAKDEMKQKADAMKALQAAEKEREKIFQEEQKSIATITKAWTDKFEEQQKAADDAAQMVTQGYAQMEVEATKAATGVGQLSRGVALLGFAGGEATKESAERLAKVQGAIDLISGSYSVITGLVGIWDGLNKAVLGSVMSAKASAAAAKTAEIGSDAVAHALSREALSAREAAAGHRMLEAARENQKAATAAGKGTPSTAAGEASRGGRAGGAMATAGAGIIAGGSATDMIALGGTDVLVDVIAENSAVTQLQTRALIAIQAFGGSLKAWGMTLGAKLGLPAIGAKLALVGKAAGAVVAGFAATAAAMGAAVLGVGFAMKSAYELGKSLQTGETEIGSWADTIASSEVRALSWVGKVTGAFDLIGDAAVEEAQRRLGLFDLEEQRRKSHLSRIEAIEINAARKIAEINRDFESKSLEQKMKNLKGEENSGKRQELLADSLADLKSQMEKAGGPDERRESLEGQESSLMGRIALEMAMIDKSDLIEAEKELKEAMLSGSREAQSEATEALEAARTANKEAINEGQIGKMEEELAKVRADLETQINGTLAEREAISQRVLSSAERLRDEIISQNDAEKKLANQRRDEAEKVLRGHQNEIDKIREKVDAERKGIQDVIDAKRKANADEIKSAQRQFAELSNMERARLKSLTDRLAAGGRIENKRDLEIAMKVDTPENKKAIDDFYERDAVKKGFNTSVGRNLVRERDALKNDPNAELERQGDTDFMARQDKLKEQVAEEARLLEERNAAINEYAEKFQIDPAELQKRLEAGDQPGVKMELIDRREIHVKIDEVDKEQLAQLQRDIDAVYAASKQRQEAAVQAATENSVRKNREDFDRARIAGNAAR